MIAGYMGGIVDEVLMRLVDFVFALPFIVVALVASVVWGASLELVIILLSLFTWAPFARQVRAESLQLKTMDYVALARVAGASGFRITVRHILPGVVNHSYGAVVPAGRFLDTHGVGAQFPRGWDTAAAAIVGQYGVRGASVYFYSMVDFLLPWVCHLADSVLDELLRRLVA